MEIVDVTSTLNEEQIVESFISSLELPDMYGQSFESLANHFFYDPEMKIPEQLIVKGINEVEKNNPLLGKKLRTTLEVFAGTIIYKG